MESSYVLFRDRPDWKDVTPVKQDDGPNPVAPIAYSEKCFHRIFSFILTAEIFHLDKDAMDYFRALLRTGEKSERALQLSEAIIIINSSNFNVWFAQSSILFITFITGDGVER